MTHRLELHFIFDLITTTKNVLSCLSPSSYLRDTLSVTAFMSAKYVLANQWRAQVVGYKVAIGPRSWGWGLWKDLPQKLGCSKFWIHPIIFWGSADRISIERRTGVWAAAMLETVPWVGGGVSGSELVVKCDVWPLGPFFGLTCRTEWQCKVKGRSRNGCISIANNETARISLSIWVKYKIFAICPCRVRNTMFTFLVKNDRNQHFGAF